jgi:hypothetical protein
VAACRTESSGGRGDEFRSEVISLARF